jgi:phage I-like protein
MIVIKNDKGEDLVFQLSSEGEDLPIEVTVKDGEEYEVPADKEAEILKWYLGAVLKASGETEEPEPPKDDGETKPEADTETEVAEKAKLSEAEAKLSEERVKLAEEKASILREKAELKFDKLLKDGKLVPAQKDAFMALLSKAEVAVTVSEGNSKTVSELLNELIESSQPVNRLNEASGSGGDGDNDELPELSEEEQSLGEMFGNSKEDLQKIKQEEGK